MSFADHIRACNNYDRARVVPLIAGGRRIGWLRRDNAAALARFPLVFAVEPERVHLVAEGDVDLVLADLRMPGTDGEALLDRLSRQSFSAAMARSTT